MTKAELVSKLQVVLNAKDFNVTESDRPLLEYEVERAIAEINKCRRFTPTDDVLYDKKYESLIIPLCVSAFAKAGAEGQTSHTENGIVRNYTSGGDYPKDILNSIIPLIK
jgi:hypothetical protein